MTITYENTLEDVIAFTEVYYRTIGRKGQQRQRITNTGIVFLMLLLLLWGEGLVPAVFMAVAVSVLLFFFWPAVMKSYIKSYAKKMYLSEDAPGIGIHQLFVEEHGIREKDQGSETFFEWSRVKAIIRDDQRVIIYLGGVLAHIIPANGTRGDVTVEEFVGEIARRAHLDIGGA